MERDQVDQAQSVCKECEKAARYCVCADVKPIKVRTEVLILRHPREQDMELGTAPILHKALPNSVLKTGLSWRNLKAAVGHETSSREWLALYLGAKKFNLPREQRYAILDRKNIPVDPNTLGTYHGIIVLDGTWSQAKALWWRNSWLTKVNRLVLNPERPSLYGNLRREPRRNSLSTLESVAMALGIMEKNAAVEQGLLEPFKVLLGRCK